MRMCQKSFNFRSTSTKSPGQASIFRYLSRDSLIVRIFLDFIKGGVSENPCPNPTEILDGEQMNHGSNALTKKKPKYKLSIGKLRRGFEPERTYKSEKVFPILKVKNEIKKN